MFIFSRFPMENCFPSENFEKYAIKQLFPGCFPPNLMKKFRGQSFTVLPQKNQSRATYLTPIYRWAWT